MAASLAPGKTVIDNCAQEPEVLDVIAFLTKMGARITGGGTGFITVHGVDELTAVEHTVMADRIDAGVFAMAAAITGGEISLVGAVAGALRRGPLEARADGRGVRHQRRGGLGPDASAPLRPINVITGPYPGFATDLQSPIMALTCLAEGASYIRETIFDGRYTLVGELNKMGAKVEFDGSRVVVHGPCRRSRAPRSSAHDLRTGIALVLAGLGRRGRDPGRPRLPDRPRARRHRPALQRPRRGRGGRYPLRSTGVPAGSRGVGQCPRCPLDEEEATMEQPTMRIGIEPGLGLVGRFGATVILIPRDQAAGGRGRHHR